MSAFYTLGWALASKAQFSDHYDLSSLSVWIYLRTQRDANGGNWKDNANVVA